ncbi:MAG: response regulator [Proteobacteria bacterium]|nr:response regulator [Pseudomonadota bacterium]
MSKATTTAAPKPLEGRTVLVVEDNPEIAFELASTLEEAGAVVVGPVATVQGAFDQMADRAIEVALLDVTLRDDETAFPLADALAALRVPFVFISGQSSALMPPRYHDRAFLNKPYKGEEVIDRVLASLQAAAVPD